MKLSDFFPAENVVNDCDIVLTHYSFSLHKGTVTFAETEHYLKEALLNKNVVAVITMPELIKGLNITKGVISSDSPKKDFYRLHNRMFENGVFQLVEKSCVSQRAKISPLASVKENVIIEDDVVIEDFAIIESNSILKKGVFVGAHAVIGARGMHNTFIADERIWVADAGGVILSEGVQVLAHAVVQKPYFFESTYIGANSIISIQSNVAHGCQVGKNTMIAGSAQIAGYVEIGDKVWIGPSTVIAHGLQIGNLAQIMIGSVVISNVGVSEKVSGNFAMNHIKNIRKHTRGSK